MQTFDFNRREDISRWQIDGDTLVTGLAAQRIMAH